jgi:hypothetical protein
VRIIIFFVVVIYLITHMPCLGNEPQCNLCSRSSTLGTVSHITRPLSRSFKLFASLLTAFLWFRGHVWVYGPFHFFGSLKTPFSQASYKAWTSCAYQTKQTLLEWRVADLWIVRRKNPNVWSLTSFWLWYDDEKTARSGIREEKLKTSSPIKRQATWLGRVYRDAGFALKVPRCQRMALSLAVTVILTVDCERTVHLNLTNSANEWGYGQIFALVATLPAISEVTRLVLRLGSEHK